MLKLNYNMRKGMENMGKFNKYKKVIIALLIIILIEIVAFTILITNAQKKKNVTESTISEASSTPIEEAPIEEIANESNETDENTTDEPQETTENPNDTSWDEKDVKDTKVENPEKKEEQSKEKYYIRVNYGANVVTIYEKDEQGEYSKPVKAMICSTGVATPKSGTYKMSDKYSWHTLVGGVYGQYCSRITGHILFHSVPYKSNKSPDSLEYWEYDKLGTSASAGCVRLTVADAYWIYSNCTKGTYVEFYSSSDPGPLGKPSAQKISSNEICRDWDPTDNAPGNPWKNYSEPASAPEEQPKDNENSDKENTNQNVVEDGNNTLENNTANNTTVEDNTTQNNATESNTTENGTSKNEVSDNNVTNDTIANNTVENDVDNNSVGKNTLDDNTNSTEKEPSKKSEEKSNLM